MNALKRIGRKMLALHKDEQGADMVEYILIMAAIALPIVGIVIWFKKDISDWASRLWSSAKNNEGTEPTNN